MVKAHGAVIHGIGQSWSVEELDVREPAPGEVLIKVTATGLCHSDDHIVTGDIPVALPQVGGHEGAGIVEAVGPGVTYVKPGDRVCTLFIPACGKCRYCATGRSYICNGAAGMDKGFAVDGTPRFFLKDGRGIGSVCRVGSFANYTVVHESQAVAVPDWISDVAAALVSCGVPTGWGAVVNRGGVRAGDVVVVVGAGGIGMNAVQAARMSGASAVIVIDPVAFKRDTAVKFGATDTFESVDAARERVAHLTNGQGADLCVVSVGRVDGDIIGDVFDYLTGKDGTCVVVSIGSGERRIAANPKHFSNLTKTLTGALYGNCNPRADIPRLLSMYSAGQLKIDELVTRTYRIDQVNEAYTDLFNGKNIRGVILHEH